MTLVVALSLLAKSSIVALAGLIAARLVGRRAADRADVLRIAVVLLLALPVGALVLPDAPLRLLTAAPASIPAEAVWSGRLQPAPDLVVSGRLLRPDPAALLGILWGVGALVVFGRFLTGVLALARWTEEGAAAPAAWRALLDKMAGAPRPRLVQSPRVRGPLSWGVRPGAILIDPASGSRDSVAAAAILAHELAHIRRRDWLFLLLSRAALALFWFNPLVWRLHVELAERSEEAADALAVTSVDRDAYARTLVRMAGAAPALRLISPAALPKAASSRTLKTRIARLMSRKPKARRLTVAAAALALTAVATPIAAVEISARLQPPATPEAPATPATPATPPPGDASTHIYVGDGPPPPPPAAPVPPAPPRAPDLIAHLTPPPSPPPPPAPPAPPPPPSFAPPAPPEPPAHLARHAEAAARHAARIAAIESRRAAEAMRRAGQDVRRAGPEAARAAAEARAASHAAADFKREAVIAMRHAQDAEREVRVAIADARVQMRRGADEMHRGADTMRTEADRLRDPAYRARQIERARREGRTLTDAELQALIPRLREQAGDLDRQAETLAAQSRDG